MICSFCGNVTENKRAIGMYIRAARITYIDCPECGCALSIKELRAAVRNYNEQFEEKRVRWITIHGRHIPMREKDAAGSGGSVEAGLTTAGGSGTIKATREQRKEFEKKLKGTVTAEGITITGISSHAADRMVERGKSAEEIKRVLTESSIHYPGNSDDTHCEQMDNTRVVYNDSGNIVTVVVL